LRCTELLLLDSTHRHSSCNEVLRKRKKSRYYWYNRLLKLLEVESAVASSRSKLAYVSACVRACVRVGTDVNVRELNAAAAMMSTAVVLLLQ
jgi:hypothetical protein